MHSPTDDRSKGGNAQEYKCFSFSQKVNGVFHAAETKVDPSPFFKKNFIFHFVFGTDMFWFKFSLLFSFGLYLSSLGVSAEKPRSQGGFRRLYVVQPGPAGADGGVRVSSILTRRGAAGQPHTYNVELSANYGGQVRTRRMENQAASFPHYNLQQPVVQRSDQEMSQMQLIKRSG